jgi:hypothetical protein
MYVISLQRNTEITLQSDGLVCHLVQNPINDMARRPVPVAAKQAPRLE